METQFNETFDESNQETSNLNSFSSISDETISKEVEAINGINDEDEAVAEIKDHKKLLTKIHHIAIQRKGEEKQFQIKIPQNVESIEGIYVTIQLINPNDLNL